MPYIGKAPADIIATVIDTTTGTFSGEVDAGSLDVSGNADIDGTTNLDNTDIDGTLNVQGETTLQTHLNMGDSDIIKLGDSADLQIYHDGLHSYIDETGTGNLFIKASNNLILESATGENYLAGVANGSVTLYHDTNPKIATTSTGIDVTGTVTADGLTVDETGNVVADFNTTNSNADITLDNTSYGVRLRTNNAGGFSVMPADTTYLNVALNGDISFYEDTGTTAKFFWDSSSERLKIGDSSSNTYGGLVVGKDTGGVITLTKSGGTYAQDDLIGSLNWYTEDASLDGPNVTAKIAAFANGVSGDDAYLTFYTKAQPLGADAAESMRIDHSGNLEIADGNVASGITHTFNLHGANGTGGSAAYVTYSFVGDPNTGMFSGTADTLKFATGASERMRIDSSGNVGIGGTSFNPKLYVLNSDAGPGLTAANATAVFHGSVDIGKGGCIGFDFGASHTNYPVGLGYVITSQAGSTKGDLAFFTRGETTDTAPTERMRIDSNGRVVMGGGSLAAPRTADLQIHTDAGGGAVSFGNESSVVISTNATAAGNQGYIGSLWFGSQDIGSTNQYGWKLAGIAGYVAGDTGTSGASADLLFYTASSSQTGSERMRIDSSGRLKVNTTAHDSGRVNITENLALRVGLCVRSNYSANTGNFILFTSDNGTNAGAIRHDNASTVSYLTSSDYRLKKNITYDFEATSRLKQLKPARFSWNDDDTNTLVDGFIAHEVQSVIPQAVGGEKDAINEDGSINPQGIDQSKLVPLLVKTIQELEARIVALESA